MHCSSVTLVQTMWTWLSVLVAVLIWGGYPSAVAAAPRFFVAGGGRLVMGHGHLGTTLDVRYRRADDSYDPAALAEINRFFRSRGDGREGVMSLRLIELLASIRDRFRPREMVLLSGYRSPQFNADLRAAGGDVAQASLHAEAMAADVALAGVDLRDVWRRLRAERSGGAGYYASGGFLHLDTGPPRFWEEHTSRVREDLAAGNARVFARTDFDRYEQLEGALIAVHNVTVLPLRIAASARVGDGRKRTVLRLRPTDPSLPASGECFTFAAPAGTYRLRVVEVSREAAGSAAGPGRRAPIVLSTCAPLVDRTPGQIESNPVEVLGR